MYMKTQESEEVCKKCGNKLVHYHKKNLENDQDREVGYYCSNQECEDYRGLEGQTIFFRDGIKGKIIRFGNK